MSGIGERRSARHVIVPYGASNASVRARALQWIDRLVADGTVERDDVVVHGPDWPRVALPADVPVLLLRNAGRVTRGRRERRILRRGTPSVYDLDDGLPWDDGTLPGLGRWWKRPFPRSLVADRAARACDRVVVGNELLADWASTRCGDVRMVPTCVEPTEYRRRTEWSVGERPVIGWIGSPATEPYLGDIAAALAEVHRRTGARLEVVSGPRPLDPRLAGFATKVPWTPDAVERIATWDIGIMPLRDGVYERAKCGYKLLQYAASGVPAIAAPVGVNAGLVRSMDGIAASTPDEWVDALSVMLDEDASARERRAARGLEVAEAYSYRAWQARWVDAVGW